VKGGAGALRCLAPKRAKTTSGHTCTPSPPPLCPLPRRRSATATLLALSRGHRGRQASVTQLRRLLRAEIVWNHNLPAPRGSLAPRAPSAGNPPLGSGYSRHAGQARTPRFRGYGSATGSVSVSDSRDCSTRRRSSSGTDAHTARPPRVRRMRESTASRRLSSVDSVRPACTVRNLHTKPHPAVGARWRACARARREARGWGAGRGRTSWGRGRKWRQLREGQSEGGSAEPRGSAVRGTQARGRTWG
jgi:hypothetical protein